MRVEDIKARVSVADMLTHFGSTKHNKKWRCLWPSNHTNGDIHHSTEDFQERAFCRSQQCFGPHGADIFEIVGLMENLRHFADQKAWIETTFGLKNGTLNPKKTMTAAYDYTDAKETVLFQTVRYVPKAFRQRRPDGQGGWIWDLKGVRLVLYRLPEVMQATQVVILEGEKDVEAAYQLGLPSGYAATTAPMGGGKWRADYSESLKGKTVIICPDQDEPGQRHGHQVAHALVSANSREAAR